jgi:genome maintenance exonuclease 1
MKFNHDKVELPKIKQKNKALPDGGRGYETPEGNLYPSITTVLSIRNKKKLYEWRKRVGNDVANYIARTAASRGTAVHKMCEDYLNNQHLEWPSEFDKHKSKNFLAWCMFVQMRDVLEKVDNIRCLESSLYSDELKLAGQVDCIAEYKGKLSIIDFKTSTKEKKEEWIENYYIQTCAYAEMFEERTGQEINQLAILIVTQDGTVQEFVKDKKEYLPLLDSALKDWYSKNQ